MYPIKYKEPVFRPPSEARSFLVQLTIGCSNNMCTYCDMYRSKSYYERPFHEIEKELIESKEYFDKINHRPKRIFLCDGDALGASQSLLVKTLNLINKLYPDLDRVGVYATAQNMLDKSEAQLKELVSLKLNMAYLGLESGNDKILHMIVKKNTRDDMIKGSLKLKKAGFKLSIIAMLGIGGKEKSEEHITDTSSIINIIKPNYFSFLTTMAIPGTPYAKMIDRKKILPLSCKELFMEMKRIISKIESEEKILFRANHVSNQFPLGGTLPHDKEKLLGVIENWILGTPEDTYPELPSQM
jgi:radical SAM superfamily enzyme YgiQ (UPF0313 family)